MKKKLLSLALVLVLALTLLPTAAFAEEPEGETTPIEAPAASETPTVPENTEPEQKQETTPESTPITTETPAAPPLAAPAAEGSDPGTTTGDPTPPTGSSTTTCTHTGTKWIKTNDGKCQEVCTDDTCRLKDQTPTDHTPGTWTTDATNHSQNCSKCGAELVAETAHSFDSTTGKCTTCQYVCLHDNKTEGTCTICQKVLSTPTTPTSCDHTSLTLQNGSDAKDAKCNADGVKKYYQCTCGKYFIDGDRNTPLDSAPSADKLKIPATGKHTAPADGTGGYISSTQHSYTCTVCGQTATGEHTYVNGVCTVCNTTQTSTPSPYRYIDISSAYVNSYSFTVTWASDLPQGTSFDIYLDNTWYTTVTPSKSGNYFSATVSTSRYLDDSYYYVSVYQYGDHTVGDSVKVYGRYYDRDHYYWDGYWEDGYWHPSYRPDYNTTPSTNSSGIPYASQVTGRYSASEAIRILRNTNSTRLQNELMGSSSARSSYDSLERAVKSANNVSVAVSTDRTGVPSALRAGSGVQISGAAFNASSTNSTVRLVVDAPSVNRYVGHGYQFSMSLTGVGNDSSLDVPVVVSMPLPSDINSNFVRVLHYHNSNVPTVITPQVSGGRIRFTLTGFSDFVITDNGVPYTYVSDGLGGYYVRRDLTQQQLAVALPILTTVPTGYVYTDVSGNYWASSEIAWAQSAGILSGYTDGTFRPYSGTTRQELWMVLARLSGANPAHMQAARDWAMNAGITDGRNPESPLSHQQMITMLYRYASYRGMNLAAPTTNLSLYRDSASISPYARTPMAWAINRGIVTGNGTGYLNPQNIASRADFAVYLYRFVQ